MKVTGVTNIRNRFDIEVKNTKTGDTENYYAENIILSQMYDRLVNFTTFFNNIHIGSGTGEFSPGRTSLFNHLDSKTAATVEKVYELPVSHRMRRIILNPEDLVGETLTEVGVAYSSSESSLLTHAYIKDEEGNITTINKAADLVVIVNSTIYFDLGQLESMYSGRLRWVMPLEHNRLMMYLMGSSMPTLQYMVSQAHDFAPGSHEGCAPGYHYQTADITLSDWIKEPGNKKVKTPSRRVPAHDGLGEIRCYGLGSSVSHGIFRGQFPIPGVFENCLIEGEYLGDGDGIISEYDLDFNNPGNLVLRNEGEVINSSEYTALPVKKGTNLFKIIPVQHIDGEEAPGANSITDLNTNSGINAKQSSKYGIDVGEQNGNIEIDTFRIYRNWTSSVRQVDLRGSNNPDFSDSELLATHSGSFAGWYTISLSEPAAYRYYIIHIHQPLNIAQVEILSAHHQITFDTAPASGVISADYTVDYIPKDTDHVLDLQLAIQYGEG